MEIIELRASSLPAYTDCPRRTAARMLRQELKEYGLGSGGNSVAASMGTALHSMMAELFRAKMAYGSMTVQDVDNALERVKPAFESELNNGVVWDQTTPRLDTALKQIRAMAAAFLPIARAIDPLIVEEKLEYILSPLGKTAIHVKLTGHMDVLDKRREIHDHKTGASLPSPHAQLGAYALLAYYHGYQPADVRVNYVPRMGITKLDEIMPVSYRLDYDTCVSTAWNVIKEFQRHYEQWRETKDPDVWPPNPMSQSCTEKYCPAFATGFCKVGFSPIE